MRVYALGLVMILSSATAAVAQNQGSGVKAGINFAELQFEGDVDLETERRTGFIGGVFFVWPVAPHFAIQPEGLYAQKGGKLSDEDGGGTLKLDYFAFPVLLRWDSAVAGESRFNVFGGPSFNFRHRARSEEVLEAEDTDISENVEKFDLGIVLGAGLEFGHFLLDGRYEHGLRPVNKDRASDDFEIKNRSFSIMGGYRF